MFYVAIQLLISAVFLALWVIRAEPLNLWFSGFTVGIALASTLFINNRGRK